MKQNPELVLRKGVKLVQKNHNIDFVGTTSHAQCARMGNNTDVLVYKLKSLDAAAVADPII